MLDSNSPAEPAHLLWRLLVPFLAGFVTYIGTLSAAISLGASMGTGLLITFAATALVVLGVVWFSARHFDRRPMAAYGYEASTSWMLDLGMGTVLGGVIAGMAFLIARQMGSVTLTGGPGAESVSILWLAAFFGGFVCVAIWEELVFRGVFLTNGIEGLRARDYSLPVAVAVALIGSSVVFTSLHVPGAVAEGYSPWLVGLRVILAGVLFGLAYLFTGELALPMGLHLGINFASINVLGMAPMAQTMEGVPTMLSVEISVLGDGLAAPMSGLPIFVSLAIGFVLVASWCYWRGGDLQFALAPSHNETAQ